MLAVRKVSDEPPGSLLKEPKEGMRPRVSTEKPVPAVGTRDPETNNTAGRPWRRLSALPSRRQSDPDPDPDPVRPRRPVLRGEVLSLVAARAVPSIAWVRLVTSVAPTF